MSALTTWPVVRLGDTGQSLIGLTYSPSNVKRSGTLVLRSSNIQDGQLAFDDNVYVDSPIPDKIRVRKNDILICVRNGSRRLIGKSVILDDRVVGQTFGAFMAVYRSDANPFLQYFFQSDNFKHQIDEHLGATINQITNASLNSFVVALPKAAEQRVIVLKLQDADRLIATIERLIAKKKSIKQGMMQELLTGRTRLPGFNGPWELRPFPEVMVRLNAKKHQILASSYSTAGRLPVVDQGQKPIVGYTDNLSARFDPGAEGVVVFGDHTCITKFIDFDFTVGADGTQLVKAKDGNSTRFFAYALEVAPVISTGYNRHFKFLREKVFPAPEKAEQDAIAASLRDADREVEALQERLAKARDVKTGMIQQLLTGRVRLPLEAAI